MKNQKPIPVSPVSAELANAINTMSDLLKKEFGCDYAFVISANGHYVAGSSYVVGVITPVIKDIPSK